jgi:hypothetical protein
MQRRFGLLITALIVAMLTPSVVSAIYLEGQDNSGLTPEELMVAGLPGAPAASKYAADSNVVINEESPNDLIVAGGNIEINANVADNLMAAGNNVVINSEISGDVWIAANNVVINAAIQGDVRIAAGNVYINTKNIGGELTVAAAKLTMPEDAVVRGGMKRSVMSYSTNTANSPTKLAELPLYKGFGSDFRIVSDSIQQALNVVKFVITIITFIGSVLAGYIALRLFPTYAEKSLTTMRAQPWLAMLTGIAIILAAPIAAGLLAISIVGWPLLVLLMAVGFLALILGHVYAQYLVGRLLLIKLGKTHTGRIWAFILGASILQIIMLILDFFPVVGWFVGLLLSLALTGWGVGAMILNKMPNQTAKP